MSIIIKANYPCIYFVPNKSETNSKMFTVGVVAFQGAFKEHVDLINSQFSHQFKAIEVRTADQLDMCHGIILPGGESTAHVIIGSDGFWSQLRQLILDGLPVWGTCAGAILLCKNVFNSGSDEKHRGLLGVLDCSIVRNHFGSQSHSAIVKGRLKLSECEEDYDMVLIRAPVFTETERVEVLAESKTGEILAVKQQNVMASTFHPELLF